MLNLNELESKWLRYKIKSYIPYFIILSSLIIITLISTLVEFPTSEEAPVIIKNKIMPLVEKEKIIIKEEKKKEILKAIIQKEVPVIIETPKKIVLMQKPLSLNEEKKLIIKPSLNFMNNIKRTSPQHYQEENMIPPPVFTNVKKIKRVKQVKEEAIIVEAPEVEIVKNSTISIQRQNTHEDIQHVIKRFKKSNNPALSLFAAKKYYELEDYNQAYNYALITNELNNDIEESWIIFTKSLVKLDKKEKAIEILKKYINNSHSQRAKILLDNIRSGKIK